MNYEHKNNDGELHKTDETDETIGAEGADDVNETEKNNEETELKALKETHLRILAEYDNFRKRTKTEREELYGEVTATTVSAFLPILDNFERALSAKTDDAEWKKGVELIYNQFKDVLNKFKVEEIAVDSFDPKIHNAVMHEENDELPENSIVEVYQKGYKIGDRVLRFAMVKVAN